MALDQSSASDGVLSSGELLYVFRHRESHDCRMQRVVFSSLLVGLHGLNRELLPAQV
ncbi:MULTISPECIES: hypothetical protein [unclassified Prochlorococcus]|uniref:hypothetical protein n=1 Tax=unclassified Prochlorococcus TaxID=2627481 RepID=UPI0005338460|nr:hypothetical protein [Prochlorococcus sp. MIT 0702]KGG28502.1 hypothetical protein EV13_1535 [Prochlorococcus sp. MIT 0702]KGG29298.1 hypothetical protein EV12_0221 [Prochlorococcus sp. MIT 0701]KGG31491.1 hypothetical protein EV14_2222 [Prochlorococcus sp. MIT 0703]